MNNLGVNVSDDREFKKDWSQTFSESKESYRKAKTEDDKKMIEQFSIAIKKVFADSDRERWEIVFLTKFGESDVVYHPVSGKWNSKKGKAKGRGAISMFNYYNPIQTVK